MTVASDHRARFVLSRPRVTKRGLVLAMLITLAITAIGSSAWAYWTATSVPGGNGAAGSATVSPVAAPTVVTDHGSLIVQWPMSKLDNGTTDVTDYVVKRYKDGSSTANAITAGECAGTVHNYGCIDNNVPAGSWTYTVTPRYATNWVGAESSKSVAVISDALPPQNHVYLWITP